MIRIIIALLWAAVLAAFPFVAQAQNSFPTPGGGTVPGVVLMCDNGQHLYVPCTNAPPVITPISIMLSTNSVSFANPANANALVATITVAAMGGVYAGPLTLSGTDAAKFALSSSNYPANLMVGASNLATGTYHVSITAGAVTTPFTIAVTVPVATGISLSATSVNFPSATNANANVATITVAATGGTYVGPLTLGGADAAKFALSSSTYPANLLIGSSNLAAGTYNISITAAPVTTPFTITVTVSTLTQVFNCTGFAATGAATTGLCGVRFPGSGPGTTFLALGVTPGLQLVGTQLQLIPANGQHYAQNVNYESGGMVNVSAFSTTFTYVPNGENVAFVLQNNNNSASAGTGSAFQAGAGCEGSFFQGFPGVPNNTFAVQLEQYNGNIGGSNTFTHSSVQYYDTGHTAAGSTPSSTPPGQSPCNDNLGGTGFTYVGMNKISTAPISLNNPPGTLNTTTGDTYSVTITYDGSNLSLCLFDVTLANGSCSSGTAGTGTFFTNTWTGVNIPFIVGGTTAWVGLSGGSGSGGQVAASPLLINSWSYSAPVPLTQVFNCPSGFGATGPCSVGFIGSGSGFTFKTVGTNAGTTPAFSGSAVNLVNTAANHVALNFNYQPAAVNVGQFSTTFTFVPDGQGIALILSNNTNAAAANPAAGGNFSGGASCEGAFFQGYTSSSPVNNTFALMLDSYGGNTAGSATFTYSNVQWYDTGHTPPNPPNAPGDDPCNPNPGGALLIPYVGVNKISTSPVALNSPVNTVNTSTGHTYSATVTYDGSNLTINMFDVTAGGACPGAACFTNTWTGVNIPTVVGGSTAWVGLGGATGTIVNPSPLLINGWTYSSN